MYINTKSKSRDMLHHRVRILASIIVAFLVVAVYGKLTSTPFISTAQADNIKGLLSNIKFPKLNLTKLFTLRLNQDDGNINQSSGNVDFINNPPSPTKEVTNSFQPTPISPTVVPLSGTKAGPTSPPTRTPTPRPTSTPKPTPTPKPPAITTALRPGTSLGEIFDEVEKRLCIPAPLLHAFQTVESGDFFNYNNPVSTIKIYNTYGWWITGAGDPTFGLGYSTQSGLIPEDSVRAGQIGRAGVQPGTYDQKIMGILKISQFEQDAAKKYMTGIIKGNIDRRVLFDNTVIFAIITKNRLGSPPKNCSVWPDDVIRDAAEKHYGSCGDNYCANILKYYKQYK